MLQLGLPEGPDLLPVQPGQAGEHRLTVFPLLGFGQLQRQGQIGRVAGQGQEHRRPDLLPRLGEQLPQPGGGVCPLQSGDDLHPPGHLLLSGGVQPLLQQGDDGGGLGFEDVQVQLGQLPVAVPQSGDEGGQNPVVGKEFWVAGPGGFDKLHPSSALPGEGGEEGADLAVGQGDIHPAPRGEGVQPALRLRGPLGVHHRVHQGQQVQQQTPLFLPGGGEEAGEPLVDFSKHRAGGGQGFQALRRPLEPKILGEQSGPGHGGLLQSGFDIIKRL